MSGISDFSVSTWAARVMALAPAPRMTTAPSWSIIRRVTLAAWVGFSELVSAITSFSLAPFSDLMPPSLLI